MSHSGGSRDASPISATVARLQPAQKSRFLRPVLGILGQAGNWFRGKNVSVTAGKTETETGLLFLVIRLRFRSTVTVGATETGNRKGYLPQSGFRSTVPAVHTETETVFLPCKKCVIRFRFRSTVAFSLRSEKKSD